MHDWKEILADELGRSPVGRDASSLREEEWQAIDDETVGTLERMLVARQILGRTGAIDTLPDAGYTEVKRYERSGRRAAVVDMSGEPDAGDATKLTPKKTLIPITHAESALFWRNVLASRHGREPLETSEQAAASIEVGKKEDSLWLLGDSELGIDGVLNPTGKQTVTGGAWSTTPTTAYDNVNAAVEKLETENVHGARVLVVHPKERASLRKRFGTEGAATPESLLLGSGLVDSIVSTTVRAAGTAALVCPERAYMKGIIAQDFISEELPARGKNLELTTWAASTVQVRQAKAAVEISSIT